MANIFLGSLVIYKKHDEFFFLILHPTALINYLASPLPHNEPPPILQLTIPVLCNNHPDLAHSLHPPSSTALLCLERPHSSWPAGARGLGHKNNCLGRKYNSCYRKHLSFWFERVSTNFFKMMMLKMMNPMGSMPVRYFRLFHFVYQFSYLQSVPGTGESKEEEKGMTMEEKKEAEKQR